VNKNDRWRRSVDSPTLKKIYLLFRTREQYSTFANEGDLHLWLVGSSRFSSRLYLYIIVVGYNTFSRTFPGRLPSTARRARFPRAIQLFRMYTVRRRRRRGCVIYGNAHYCNNFGAALRRNGAADCTVCAYYRQVYIINTYYIIIIIYIPASVQLNINNALRLHHDMGPCVPI